MKYIKSYKIFENITESEVSELFLNISDVGYQVSVLIFKESIQVIIWIGDIRKTASRGEYKEDKISRQEIIEAIGFSIKYMNDLGYSKHQILVNGRDRFQFNEFEKMDQSLLKDIVEIKYSKDNISSLPPGLSFKKYSDI